MWIPLATFVCVLITVPAVYSAALELIVLGDWGERLLQGQDAVADGMAAWAERHNPAYIVTTGDNIYPSGLRSVDDEQINRKWRNVYNHTSLANLTWYICVGNHDYGNDNGEEWVQVELTKYEPRWYLPHLWHDWTEELKDGNTVHFVVIDTEAFGNQINNYTVMLEWLDTTLKLSTSKWKFVIGHRHLFSSGDVLAHGGPVTGGIYDVILPIMQENNVDAYICGHDHNLQHLRNMSGEGMDYIISGAGGALPSRFVPSNERILREQYNIETVYFKIAYGFITLSIEPDSIVYDFFDESALLVYRHTRTKP